MKITREDLQRIIREELESSDRPQKPFNPAGLDDSKNVTWDDHLDAMRRIFIDIGMDVIDYYQEKPEEFGILTKEDARKEIIEVLQATVDNFVNDDLPGEVGLGEFLDDEFDDESAAWVHKACWEIAGKPGYGHYGSNSEDAEDQGWFFKDGDHDMIDPRIKDEAERNKLLEEGIKARIQLRHNQKAAEGE